ncbi:MAG: hypothetical protein H7833_12240 [Magnetococcus sp. DMHC-1]
MMRNSSKKLVSKFVTIMKMFLLILWAMLFKLAINLVDDIFIIKEEEDRIRKDIFNEMVDYGGNERGIHMTTGFIVTFIFVFYIISLISVPIIYFVVKNYRVKIIILTLELLPLLCYILIYNINSSIYPRWPHSRESRESLFTGPSEIKQYTWEFSQEKKEEILRNSVKYAIDSWQYCEAKYKYVEDADLGCPKVLMIIKSYKDKEKNKIKNIVH